VNHTSIQPADLSVDLSERPTRVRYAVLGFMCTLALVLYLDRICLGVARIRIHDELGITDEQFGWIDVAFMIPYGLFEMPIGRWGDKQGARGVITRIVVCWSIFTALTGQVSTFWGFMLVRFLFGAGEAGAFPNIARVVSRWFPGSSRGPAQGLVTAAAQIGGALSPALTAYLIEWTNWRWAFLIYGVVGVVWAAVFYWWFRDDPADHSMVNDAERQMLAASAPKASSHEHPPIPWRQVLTSPNVWLLGAAMNAGAFGFYMCVNWFPRYLSSAREVELTGTGWLSSIIQIGGACGCLLGGVFGAWFMRRIGNRRLVRRIVGCGGFLVASVAIFSITRSESAVAATLCAAMAIFATQVQLSAWWGTTADISGRHQAAMFGLMNSMGVFGGSLSNLFFSGFATWMGKYGYSGRAQWDPAFYVYCGVYLAGALCWLFIDATRSIVENTESPEGVSQS
jgi:MFS transporter, ACS family, glucarate transporter